MKDTVPRVNDLVVILMTQGVECVFTVVVPLVVQPIVRQLTKDEKERFVQLFDTDAGTTTEIM